MILKSMSPQLKLRRVKHVNTKNIQIYKFLKDLSLTRVIFKFQKKFYIKDAI